MADEEIEMLEGVETIEGAGEDTVAGADDTLTGGDDTAAGGDGDDTLEGGEAEGETVISIGDEPVSAAPEAAPEWVKQLRTDHRELRRRNRELEDQLRARAPTEPTAAALPAKPTLEGVDYDAEKFEAALAAWYEAKRAAEDRAKQAVDTEAEQKREWDAEVARFHAARDKLKLSDFEDAEQAVTDKLSVVQQGILLTASDNPAAVMYALHKSPTRLSELAAIKHPIKFTKAVVKLEEMVKVNKRASTLPAPERVVTGSGPKSGAVDSNLKRLQDEADRTGDRTKVTQYMRAQRERKAS